MTVKTGAAWAGTFVTLDATGAMATPSVGPAGVLYVDGTANAATVTITGANPYKWSVTLPSLTAGQRVDMYITATIATIATAGFVASDQADTALGSEIKADTAAILADTGTDGVVIAAAQTVATVTNLTNLPAVTTDWLTAAGVKADAVTKIQTGLALEATLTAIKGAGWSTETLAAIDVLIDAIKAKTDLLPASPAATSDIPTADISAILVDTGTTIPAQIAALNNLSAAQVNAEVVDVLRTDTIPDSYSADGAQPTFAQAVLAILQFLTEKAVSGTTVTVRKPDGSTSAMTLTLDDATNPTSITRAS